MVKDGPCALTIEGDDNSACQDLAMGDKHWLNQEHVTRFHNHYVLNRIDKVPTHLYFQ